MPILKNQVGETIDIAFSRESDHLMATLDWEVGQTYQLELDAQEVDVSGIVVRLPDPWQAPAEGENLVNGSGDLWRHDSRTGSWTPATCYPGTSIHSLGQNRIFELLGGWGSDRLRLSFTPGTTDRWFEVRSGRQPPS